MATREEKFKQAAWTYLIYGILYLGGGLFLHLQGFGPRRSTAVWFLLGAAVVLFFPYLLSREVHWFERWVLSRRDFARLLTVLVFFRAFGVGRIALRGVASSPHFAGGSESVVIDVGAWLFFLVSLGAAVMLARAAWSRP